MNRVRLLIPGLAFLACFLGWETYLAWTTPVLPMDGTPAEEAFSLRPSTALPPAVPGEDLRGALASVRARPVFRPDRRPYGPEASGAPARNYEAELSRYTVLGVLMLEDEQKALVVGKGPGKGERWEVGAGDELPGFTVKSVGPDGLVLSADGREFTLPLYAGGPNAAGSTPLRTEVPSPSAGAQNQPRNTIVLPPGPAAAPAPAAPRSLTPRRYPRTYIPGRR